VRIHSQLYSSCVGHETWSLSKDDSRSLFVILVLVLTQLVLFLKHNLEQCHLNDNITQLHFLYKAYLKDKIPSHIVLVRCNMQQCLTLSIPTFVVVICLWDTNSCMFNPLSNKTNRWLSANDSSDLGLESQQQCKS